MRRFLTAIPVAAAVRTLQERYGVVIGEDYPYPPQKRSSPQRNDQRWGNGARNQDRPRSGRGGGRGGGGQGRDRDRSARSARKPRGEFDRFG